MVVKITGSTMVD